MNLATPKEPREVRMLAAFFFQQLCQSSTHTLQMFIACKGIPTLVNLLEPDYAKYREKTKKEVLLRKFQVENDSPPKGYFVLLSWMHVYFKTVYDVNLKWAAWFSAIPF
ncbi:MAP3K epsilon protein kinase 1-like [Carex rostrata]